MDDQSYEMDRRDYLKLSGAIGLAGLAGCVVPPRTENEQPEEEHGHENEGHDETGYEEPQEHVEVEMKTLEGSEDGSRYHFGPHVAWVQEGGSVTWHNESGSHTTTSYSPDNDKPLRIPDEQYGWDSGMVTDQGATYEKTFEEEGVYDYLCVPHEGQGMLGTVVVGEPDLEHEPGMAPPQEGLPETAHEKIEELNAMVKEMFGNGHEGEEGGDEHGDGGH